MQPKPGEKVYDAALREMKTIVARGDAGKDNVEMDHSDADDVLCKLLIGIGFGEIVEEYRKIHKYFA